LCWYNCYYTVEADSEEEAQELVESGEGNLEYRDFDDVDQIDFESCEIIEE
jgi:hypothetical protein